MTKQEIYAVVHLLELVEDNATEHATITDICAAVYESLDEGVYKFTDYENELSVLVQDVAACLEGDDR